MVEHRFPFGAPSTPRPPRRPPGDAAAFVLGVYPSALHVHWRLPRWATQRGLDGRVGSLAVDVEPVVFWDGATPSAEELVSGWAADHFIAGDEPDQFGEVTPGTNGTSGRDVVDAVLAPLALHPEEVWFSDAIDTFFVKPGSGRGRGQLDVLEHVYAPFAAEVDLPPATLPPRPTAARLVEQAVDDQAERLHAEWQQAAAPLLITLGEEARQVAALLADDHDGPPARGLQRDDPAYGQAGRIDVAGHQAEWIALTHPGNTHPAWAPAREHWASWAENRR